MGRSVLQCLLALSLCGYAQAAVIEHFSSQEAAQLAATFRKGWAAHEAKKYPEYLKLMKEVLDAKVSDEVMREIMPRRVNAAYNCACGYALLKKPDLAIEYLEKAIKIGFDDFSHIKSDTDFASLKDDKRFTDLIAKYEANAKVKKEFTGKLIPGPIDLTGSVYNASSIHTSLVINGADGSTEQVLALKVVSKQQQKALAKVAKLKKTVKISGHGGGLKDYCVLTVDTFELAK